MDDPCALPCCAITRWLVPPAACVSTAPSVSIQSRPASQQVRFHPLPTKILTIVPDTVEGSSAFTLSVISFADRLVHVDVVTWLLQPFINCCGNKRFRELRHDDFRHCFHQLSISQRLVLRRLAFVQINALRRNVSFRQALIQSQIAHSFFHFIFIQHEKLLARRINRHSRNVRSAQTHNRRIQLVQQLFGNNRRYFGAYAASLIILMNDKYFARLANSSRIPSLSSGCSVRKSRIWR